MSYKDISFQVRNVLFADHRCPLGPKVQILLHSPSQCGLSLKDPLFLDNPDPATKEESFLPVSFLKLPFPLPNSLFCCCFNMIPMDFSSHDLQGSQFGLCSWLLKNLAFRCCSICETILKISVPTLELLFCHNSFKPRGNVDASHANHMYT